ncbi:MAG: DinB family protein [Chloroflexi bacterium]|nr:DinB family protein [Chloroflexota bacterium]
MDHIQRTQLIERYADGFRAVSDAVAKVGAANLDLAPADGSWTPRQIIHHLADSEMTSCLRLRRLIAEENVDIVGYPEEVWAKRVYYDRPIEPSLAAIKAARESTVDILNRMTPGEWQRAGTHNEIGVYTPEVWLEIYARHCHDHANQILHAAGLT